MPKYVGHYIKENWKQSMPFYQIKCPIHGKVINHASGYNQDIVCPICELEKQKKP